MDVVTPAEDGRSKVGLRGLPYRERLREAVDFGRHVNCTVVVTLVAVTGSSSRGVRPYYGHSAAREMNGTLDVTQRNVNKHINENTRRSSRKGCKYHRQLLCFIVRFTLRIRLRFVASGPS